MTDLLPPWSLPPAFVLLAGAPLVAALRGRARQVAQVAVPLVALWHVVSLRGAVDASFRVEWLGRSLELLQVDALRFAFGLVFAGVAVLGAVYALHVEDRLQHAAALVYAGAALGVVFAGDLLSLLVFWELMGVSSALLVFARRTVRSRRAGIRYVAVHAVGGAVLLAGVLGWAWQGGSLEVRAIPPGAGWAAWAILAGVAVNAAIPPLHAWLPDAYPEATPTGSVFLSAFTTKTAVFALLALFPGWPVLVGAGAAMALYGVVFATLEDDLRRLLSYHIVSQVGFMVAGAGLGTAAGLDGATAHAFSHILYKALLFMSAGALLAATGRARLGELGGLARRLPAVFVLFAVGAASISGVPPFNGFVSKSITLTAAGQGGWPWAEVALTLASVGTFLSIGCKITWLAFLRPAPAPQELRPIPANMLWAMGATAALCLLFGVAPGLLYGLLPHGTAYHPYTVGHVAQSVQLLVATALLFAWRIVPGLSSPRAVTLDTDWIYRRLLPGPVLEVARAVARAQDLVGRGVDELTHQAVRFAANPMRAAERWFGRGILSAGDGDPPYSADRYRVPVGVAVLAVLLVFCGLALWQLLRIARA